MSSLITLSTTGVPWAPVKAGDVLEGKYRVERVIGQGGVGIVVAAWHDVLEERVAVKLLLPEALRRERTIERFLREARTAAKLKSHHVVRVFDVGMTDSGVPFIVMEYLSGQDLNVVLRSRGRLDVPETVGYVLQACEALSEAHAAGIVHRDLKPANLFLTRAPDGSPLLKLLDFGLAKPPPTMDGSSGELTRSDAAMGTPLYMAPEQLLSSRSVDVRADIWSMGCILYRALTGALPFEGETIAAFIASVARDGATPIRERRADLPPALASVVARCLEKEPRARYQSIAELAAALAPFASGPASVAPRAAPSAYRRIAGAAGVLASFAGLAVWAMLRASRPVVVAPAAEGSPPTESAALTTASPAPLDAASSVITPQSAASAAPDPSPASAPSRAAAAPPPRSPSTSSTKHRKHPDYGF